MNKTVNNILLVVSLVCFGLSLYKFGDESFLPLGIGIILFVISTREFIINKLIKK